MLLQCWRKLLNVMRPNIISVIHEWWVKDMSGSPCPVKVNEAYVRGAPHIPVPQKTCMSSTLRNYVQNIMALTNSLMVAGAE